MIQIAYIQCGKDTYDLLEETIMPKLDKEIQEIQKGKVVLVHDKEERTGKMTKWKSYIVPNTTNMNNLYIDDNNCIKVNDSYTIDLNQEKRFKGIQDFSKFKVDVIVDNFYDFYIGDIVFLSLLLGMENSDGSHCIYCERKQRDFNCNIHTDPNKIRTKENMERCYKKFKKKTQKNCKNVNGVNRKFLLSVDPKRIIIPILHCPMGLVDKVLQYFMTWIIVYCADLPPELKIKRGIFTKQLEQVKKFKKDVQRNHSSWNMDKGNNEKKKRWEESKEIMKEMETAEKTVREEFYDSIKEWKVDSKNILCQIEAYFKRRNIKKEFYHGGKYNGVNCIKIMENADSLIDEICEEVISKRDKSWDANETEESIRATCKTYKQLLNNLGTIWSQVRGVKNGLLPTDEDKENLHNAVVRGKKLWLNLGITTYQPKWHYTFDGHLEEQYSRLGGLADKADDSIEYGHQVWPRLDERFKCVPNLKKRIRLVYRTAKRRRHPHIAEHGKLFSNKKKHSTTSNRYLTTVQKKKEVEDAKRIKREVNFIEPRLQTYENVNNCNEIELEDEIEDGIVAEVNEGPFFVDDVVEL